jgi:hypothetical protein
MFVSLCFTGKKKTTARAATGSGSRDTLVEDQEATPVISAPGGTDAQELETTYVLDGKGVERPLERVLAYSRKDITTIFFLYFHHQLGQSYNA